MASLKDEITSCATPYFSRIPVRPLRIGTLVTVRGKVNENPSRFAIDFIQNPSDPDPNIAFHFNPRFDTCQIISVDGRLTCIYEHRIHYSLINAVNINGDISLWDVEYTISESHPENSPLSLMPGTLHRCDSDDLALPYLASLERVLESGQEITVCGRVKKLPYRFHVNLLDDCRWFPRPSIILHVNPRFDEEEGYALVLNTLSSGHWGREERVRPSPFKPNQIFTLRIRKDEDKFKIYHNKILVHTFVDRLTVPVRAISVNGDVVLISTALS